MRSIPARYVGDRATAADLLQQTLIRILRLKAALVSQCTYYYDDDSLLRCDRKDN